MNGEMNSLIENNTFTLCTMPEGRNSVGGRWVYTMKESSTGAQRLHLLSKDLSLVMKPLLILDDTVKQWAAWFICYDMHQARRMLGCC